MYFLYLLFGQQLSLVGWDNTLFYQSLHLNLILWLKIRRKQANWVHRQNNKFTFLSLSFLIHVLSSHLDWLLLLSFCRWCIAHFSSETNKLRKPWGIKDTLTTGYQMLFCSCFSLLKLKTLVFKPKKIPKKGSSNLPWILLLFCFTTLLLLKNQPQVRNLSPEVFPSIISSRLPWNLPFKSVFLGNIRLVLL